MSRRRLVLASVLVIAPLFLGACAGSGTARQWYKPNVDYTSAEFEQDEKACTRDRRLDEGCLRERGWVPLSTGPTKEGFTLPQDRGRY